MKYGVVKEGNFQERKLIPISAKGFESPMWGREGTYDQYVMKEINRSYGKLDVENKIVLDIGANIGCFSRWALDRDASHVISLEPEPHNFAVLVKNTENDYNVTCHNRALTSDLDGEMELYLSPTGKNPGNSSTTYRRGRVVEKIQAMSVEQLLEFHPVIHVAKIDCEGAEYEFIETLIPAYPMLEQVALEIHISGYGVGKAEKLHEFMLSEGFTPTVPPRIQDNLWQTLATYKKD